MEFLHTLWISLIAYSMIQGFVLALVFHKLKSGSKTAKWLLSLLSFTMGLLLVEEVMSYTIGYDQWPHLIFAFSPLWYLLGPVMYLYIRLISLRKQLSWWDLLHVIPTIWVALDMLEFYQQSGAYKLHYLEIYRNGYTHPIHNFNYLLYLIQSVVYLVLSFRLVQPSKSQLRANQYSVLRYFLWGIATTVLMGISSLWVANSSRTWLELANNAYVIWLSAFLLVLFIRIIRPQNVLYKFNDHWNPHHFSDAQKDYQELLQFIRENRSYTDPNFSLLELSRATGHSQHAIKSLIRAHADCNFKELLNTFRVEEAKRQLQMAVNRNYTIQHIARNAGFTSTATFYRIFKKLEGTTPKEFLRS